MSYICYKKGVTSVTGVTNSSQISFRGALATKDDNELGLQEKNSVELSVLCGEKS